MTAAGDAWLAEMWKPCRELSREERIEKRKDDRRQQYDMEERFFHRTPTNVGGLVDSDSTGCPEIGDNEFSEGAA